MRSRVLILSLGILIFYTSVITVLAPLSDATAFGGDEGFELQKGFLFAKGIPLYRRIWSDQPPLYTVVVAASLRLAGGSSLGPRLFSLLCGATLLAGVFLLATFAANKESGLFAALIVLCNEPFWYTSCTAMQEMPMTCLVFASFLAFEAAIRSSGLKNGPARYAYASAAGGFLGLAIQTKLSAVLFGPMFLTRIWLTRLERKGDRLPMTEVGRIVAVLLVPFCVVCLVSFMIFPGQFADSLIHFRPGWSDNWASKQRFTLKDLIHVGPSLMLSLCAVRPALRRRPILIALLLGGIVIVLIHALHRPFWYYYHLTIAIPLSIVGGVGVTSASKSIARLLFKSFVTRKMFENYSKALVGVACLLIISWNLFRLSRQTNPILSTYAEVLIALRREDCMMYSDLPQASFASGYLTIPELTVMSDKRVYLATPSDEQGKDIFVRSRPCIMLISDNNPIRLDILRWAGEGYRLIRTRQGYSLYEHATDPVPAATR
jgi:4-amino-4-deoxy-L-arabinose transferase-like glycosyltransferase